MFIIYRDISRKNHKLKAFIQLNLHPDPRLAYNAGFLKFAIHTINLGVLKHVCSHHKR